MSPLETAIREFESANYGSALTLLKEVLAAEPQNAEAQRFLALTYFRLAQYDEAEQAARAFLRLRPTDADGHFQLGLILKSRGKSDDARKAFGSALEYDSKHAQAFQELTRLNEFSTPPPRSPTPPLALRAFSRGSSPSSPSSPWQPFCGRRSGRRKQAEKRRARRNFHRPPKPTCRVSRRT